MTEMSMTERSLTVAEHQDPNSKAVIQTLLDRSTQWAARCSDQERAIESRDREIAALREAIELQTITIERLRMQLPDESFAPQCSETETRKQIIWDAIRAAG